MEFSVLEMINRLDPIALVFLAMAGMSLLFLPLSEKSYLLMLLLSLSAAFVGSTISAVDNMANLLRWFSMFLLFLFGILHKKMRVSLGFVFFWAYIFFGFIFMYQAISMNWQFQRGVLLLLLAIAIPFAYGNEKYRSVKLSLISISIAGTVFSLLNFLSLPGHLGEAERFSGLIKKATQFSEVLGAFLPFILWGLWGANHLAIKIACASGFFLGIVSLILSGQRAGTIAGLLGVFPLFLFLANRKNIKWLLVLLIPPLLLGYILFQQSSAERMNFLVGRYSIESGLSDREIIWKKSFSAIDENPLMGRGIGAAENVLGDSFHNAYLEIWFNTGLLGLVFFVSSQIFFLFRISSLGRLVRNAEIKSVLALSLGYMLGFIFMSIFESIGAGASNLNMILYLFLGVLVSNPVLDRACMDSEPGEPLLAK